MPAQTRTHVRNTGCREQTEVEIVVPTNTIETYVTGRSNEEQKRKRGPTYMCSIWGYHATQHGGERLVEKFEIPRACDVWVLQSIGKKWRNWKADVKSRYYDPKISTELQLCNVPKRILKDQWKNLLTYWNSEESKCISERNKKSRSKKSLMHITGKRSFGQVREDQEKSIGHSPTRVEMFERCYTKEGITNSIEACEALEKMKEIRSQTSQTEDVGRDDIFSKVLGNDKVGRVRMYGFGVTPYVAWGEIPNRSSAYQLIEGYKEAFEKMEKQVQEQGEVIAKMKLDMQSTQQATNATILRATQYSQNGDAHSFNNSTLIQVGTKVAVKSILDSTKTVAIGYIQSMDPAHRVGNYPLGPNWCSVHINIPVNWEEHLIRPYSTLTTIGQAIGTYVAWPQALVVREDD
ncbi:hypothetical protein KFK09_006856 [Dendrobium nobile]|uniref:Transposase Tnp1/En/Spm-like domain-containing protein n=1 Tax=Dendrobium nobile TaxID=94219 RepID=A0A8T3BSQ7_DENNO|nr:hypothetical protein KFK09_006856 [Dendrobium nobile]